METTTAPIAIANGNGTTPPSPANARVVAPPEPRVSRFGTRAAAATAARRRDTAPLSSSEHLGGSRQYWRDMILGVNDGLVSTFLLVAGVAGGGLSSNDILLTAIAGSLAGRNHHSLALTFVCVCVCVCVLAENSLRCFSICIPSNRRRVDGNGRICGNKIAK